MMKVIGNAAFLEYVSLIKLLLVYLILMHARIIQFSNVAGFFNIVVARGFFLGFNSKVLFRVLDWVWWSKIIGVCR